MPCMGIVAPPTRLNKNNDFNPLWGCFTAAATGCSSRIDFTQGLGDPVGSLDTTSAGPDDRKLSILLLFLRHGGGADFACLMALMQRRSRFLSLHRNALARHRTVGCLLLAAIQLGCGLAASLGSDGSGSHERPSLVGKKIAIIHYGIPPAAFGGVEVNLQAHSEEFLELGAEVVMIGSRGGGGQHPNLTTYIDDYHYASKPQGPAPQQTSIEARLREHLQGVTHVIVHNVHSIPYKENPAFAAALHDVLRSALLRKPGNAGLESLERVVFMAHDMPSLDRPDLLARVGLDPNNFPANRHQISPAFKYFAMPIWEDDSLSQQEAQTLRSRVGYGTITRYQQQNVALLYGLARQIPLSEEEASVAKAEISRIPSTGLYPETLQGPGGLQGKVGFPAPPLLEFESIESILTRRGVTSADAVLFYASRIGVPRKRLELAVQALAEARRVAITSDAPFKNIHLVITGPWDIARPDHWKEMINLRAEIRRLNIEPYVTILAVERAIGLLGPERFASVVEAAEHAPSVLPVTPEDEHTLSTLDIHYDEVAALFRYAGGMRSDSKPGFVFMTTDQEGAGMPVAEAKAAGADIVATPLGPIQETMEGVRYGYTPLPSVPPPRDAPAADLQRFVQEAGSTILTHLTERFMRPGNNQPPRSADQLKEIEWFIDRFSWSSIVDRYWVPWLFGEPVVSVPDAADAERDPARLFSGSYLWIGPPLSGLPGEISQPSDVPYPYQLVSKFQMNFDPRKLKRIIFARHGETISNAFGIFQGSADGAIVSQELYDILKEKEGDAFAYNVGDRIPFELNANGARDAQLLADALASFLNPATTLLWASPLDRTMQTANYFAAKIGNSVMPLDALKEAGAGAWEGLHGDTQIAGVDPQHALWLANPYAYAPTNGETASDLVQRVDEALVTINQRTLIGQTSVAFTHKGFLLWLLERYSGSLSEIPLTDLVVPEGQQSPRWKVPVPNAAWAEIYLYEGKVVLPDRGTGKPFYLPLSTPDLTPNPTATGGLL
jgi:broad specificity phosphatase PhoE/glycosyltransferase involved in cell wall biosynthesis